MARSTKERVALHILVFQPMGGKTGRMGYFFGPSEENDTPNGTTADHRQRAELSLRGCRSARKAIGGGVSARPDPRRQNFYDVEHADRAFFIHVSPLTGKVMLLAVWRLLGCPFASLEEVAEVI
jgi:hypothetical protein